jgi:hypothetical protein
LLLGVVFQRETAEKLQIATACQSQGITLTGDLFDMILRPFKERASPG